MILWFFHGLACLMGVEYIGLLRFTSFKKIKIKLEIKIFSGPSNAYPLIGNDHLPATLKNLNLFK